VDTIPSRGSTTPAGPAESTADAGGQEPVDGSAGASAPAQPSPGPAPDGAGDAVEPAADEPDQGGADAEIPAADPAPAEIVEPTPAGSELAAPEPAAPEPGDGTAPAGEPVAAELTAADADPAGEPPPAPPVQPGDGGPTADTGQIGADGAAAGLEAASTGRHASDDAGEDRPPAENAGPGPAQDVDWAEKRAAELVAAVAAGTRWAEERGKAADPQAVENWFELAAPALEAAARTQEAPAAPAAPRRRRATPGARPAPPPPAPTPRRLAGSTVVKPKYSRFGLRVIVLTALAVALVVALGAAGITLLTRTHGATTAEPDLPAPQLPQLGDAKPVLAGLSSTAPAPDPTALASRLAPLLSASALGGGVNADVVDVASGQVLLDQGGAEPVAPASTAKLLTAAAALTALHPSDTIPTKVVAGATPGEVVLVGGGDPTLSRTAPSQVYPGAATLADLAAQVTAALPAGTQITRVVVDTSVFSGPGTGPGWQPDDAPSDYAAPITGVAVDGGRVSPAAETRSGSPDTDAGRALATALGARGATVASGQAPAGARQLGMVHSAPMSRLVEQTLSMSDNVLAEALARQVAIARHQPASFAGSAQAVVDAVKAAGVDVTGVQLFDGSGLSRDDRVPAQVLAQLITRAGEGKLGAGADLLSGLPVAGYDGTLAQRGDADPSNAPGTVRAKTGTLLGVSALAGTVVTADGRLLAFAVVADQVPGGVVAAETGLDAIARTLAGCGCR
jgi:D-alanyl-D-alanine carboxypeptidase/D-alanyl-D-alanine-endopeptidase (penicillin-binding protein 4)